MEDFDAMPELGEAARLQILLSVKDKVLAQDEAVQLAAEVMAAQAAGNTTLVGQLLRRTRPKRITSKDIVVPLEDGGDSSSHQEEQVAVGPEVLRYLSNEQQLDLLHRVARKEITMNQALARVRDMVSERAEPDAAPAVPTQEADSSASAKQRRFSLGQTRSGSHLRPAGKSGKKGQKSHPVSQSLDQSGAHPSANGGEREDASFEPSMHIKSLASSVSAPALHDAPAGSARQPALFADEDDLDKALPQMEFQGTSLLDKYAASIFADMEVSSRSRADNGAVTAQQGKAATTPQAKNDSSVSGATQKNQTTDSSSSTTVTVNGKAVRASNPFAAALKAHHNPASTAEAPRVPDKKAVELSLQVTAKTAAQAAGHSTKLVS